MKFQAKGELRWGGQSRYSWALWKGRLPPLAAWGSASRGSRAGWGYHAALPLLSNWVCLGTSWSLDLQEVGGEGWCLRVQLCMSQRRKKSLGPGWVWVADLLRAQAALDLWKSKQAPDPSKTLTAAHAVDASTHFILTINPQCGIIIIAYYRWENRVMEREVASPRYAARKW